jgi:O-antigen ligase
VAATVTSEARRMARAQGWSWIQGRATSLLDWSVAFWVFSGFLVFAEPSPYEITFLLTLAIAGFGGLALRRSTLGLLVIFMTFLPFAFVSAFQVRFQPIPNAIIFTLVTAFLLLTAYFVANYVADAPQRRMRLIIIAFTAGAVISALIGTLGYLGLLPNSEMFTRYGRAKALFKDPNVFGPFMVLPAIYAMQRVMVSRGKAMAINGAIFAILFVGVFVSFSRAAWGHLALSAIIGFALMFLLESDARQKVRLILLAMAGVLVLAVTLAGLLSIPQVRDLFEVRASSQEYDTGESGRFGRQGYALELAIDNPQGLGPLEFRNLRIAEEPHNTYVNVLHQYGWGGGLMIFVFIFATIWRGVTFVARPSPNRMLLIPLVATFVPLSGEAAIIDIDHWRHFFLIGGLIWGVTAAYDRVDAPVPLKRQLAGVNWWPRRRAQSGGRAR